MSRLEFAMKIIKLHKWFVDFYHEQAFEALMMIMIHFLGFNSDWLMRLNKQAFFNVSRKYFKTEIFFTLSESSQFQKEKMWQKQKNSSKNSKLLQLFSLLTTL